MKILLLRGLTNTTHVSVIVNSLVGLGNNQSVAFVLSGQ